MQQELACKLLRIKAVDGALRRSEDPVARSEGLEDSQ